MKKVDIKRLLYSDGKSLSEFNFDALVHPSMYNYITPTDVYMLHSIAISTRLASNIREKIRQIKAILEPRGFKKYAEGTNRIIFKYLDDPTFLLKIALDKVGLKDNPLEFKNQYLLQPFVTKMFEISPCGTVGMAERVKPITSRIEFASIGESIFDLITKKIIGKYVVDDIGTKYFMNYGMRKGFGPVLLDYPYVYPLDGSKLVCRVRNRSTGNICCGDIDYDDGFNDLVCTKCGRKYYAKELEKDIRDEVIFINKKGKTNMKVELIKNGQVIISRDTSKEKRVIRRKSNSRIKAELVRNNTNTESKSDNFDTSSTFIPSITMESIVAKLQQDEKASSMQLGDAINYAYNKGILNDAEIKCAENYALKMREEQVKNEAVSKEESKAEDTPKNEETKAEEKEESKAKDEEELDMGQYEEYAERYKEDGGFHKNNRKKGNSLENY